VENKRAPSRKTDGDDLESKSGKQSDKQSGSGSGSGSKSKSDKQTEKLSEQEVWAEVWALLQAAREELFSHCTHYFQMYPNSRSVIAIATAGAYWTHKVVQHSNTFVIGKKSQKAKGDRFYAWSKLAWSKIFEIGTPASDEELAKLEKKVKIKKPWSRQELDGH